MPVASNTNAQSSRKSCATCHDLDRAKTLYWKGGPSRHRMFKRYFSHADYYSLKVPLHDLKWSASKSCPFCVVAFDIYRWLARVKGDGSRALQYALIEICIPFKTGYPVVLTYSWGEPVPRAYDFQLTVPKIATALPWSALTVGTQIPKDPRQSFFRAASWLQNCLADHSKAKCVSYSKTFMPTRLLYIGEGVHRARLVESEREQKAYVALSYCWGSTPHVSTTSATYSKLLGHVPTAYLPKTCTDAIHIARALGYRYLWIDSLCIKQDDREEWYQEASRMGDIYQNAVFTISATNASHVGFGCLNHRPESRTFKNRLRRAENDPNHIIVREPNVHLTMTRSSRSEEDWPLNRRAWCTQERLLSTRVLHFGPGELLWECNTSAACECGHMDNIGTPKLRYGRSNLDRLTADERAQAWDELTLLSYQNRSLTKETDRFPALSALAQQFQTDALGHYAAGLWSNYALSMLLWEVKAGQKSSKYVAPSWSWASIRGTLTRNDRIVHNRNFNAIIEQIACTPASLDPYGAIRSGIITMTTPTADGVLSTGGHHGDTMIMFNKHVRAFFVQDADEGQDLFGAKVKCAFLRALKPETGGRYVEALVTRLTADLRNYQRIGIAHLTKTSLAHTDDLTLATETVTII